MVILLDPRSLLPMDVNVEKAFEDSGKLLGCAFSLAGTGDRDALFRGEIPLRHYVILEKILLRSFHVSQSIFWIILILEDPCMSLQSPCQKALIPVGLWPLRFPAWKLLNHRSHRELGVTLSDITWQWSAKVPGVELLCPCLRDVYSNVCYECRWRWRWSWNLPPK